MKNLIRALIIGVFCSLTMQIKAQYYEQPKEKPRLIDRLFFGGGLGLQFGDITQIEVAPIVGYKVTERFHVGVGVTYSYFKAKTTYQNIDYSTYGGSVFARFFIFEGLFAQAEAEALNTKVFYLSGAPAERRWIENYLVGGGYFQKIGPRSGVYLLVLWNLNETEFTPYTNPVIRIGFSF